MNYEEKASNTDYIIEYYAHIFKEQLSYISIPLLLKFKITDKPMISIYSGVYANYLIHDKLYMTYYNEPYSNHIRWIVGSRIYDDIDLGWIIGCDYMFPLSKTNFIILDLRYNGGLSKLESEAGGKNQSLVLSAGYVFTYK